MMTFKDASPNLMVKDVNRTIDFYTNILGFKLINAIPETGERVFAIVQSGQVMFMFQEERSLKEEYFQLETFPRGGGLTFYIHVTDIKTLYEKLKGKVTIVKDMHTTFYGSTDFAIEDCNGYILTFSQEGSAPLIQNYDNFILPAKDIEASKSFYAGLLELPLKFDFSSAGMVAYHVGDEEPAIILKDLSKFPDFPTTIWFVVDNVFEKYKMLTEKGVKFISEPFKIKTGWAVEFNDPSGNRLGITDYVG